MGIANFNKWLGNRYPLMNKRIRPDEPLDECYYVPCENLYIDFYNLIYMHIEHIKKNHPDKVVLEDPHTWDFLFELVLEEMDNVI